MSRAPIMERHDVVPKPAKIGMTNRKIIVVPCIVKIWL